MSEALDEIRAGKAQLPSIEALKAERRRRSLAAFVKHYWHVLENDLKLEWNWHHEEICKVLEQTARREIRGFVISVPPGSLKSGLVSVMYPAWSWLPGNWPSRKTMYFSGTERVSVRDAMKTRLILESEEYRKDCALLSGANGWASWEMSEDQNQKQHFINTLHGSRYALTVGQKVTGLRGDEIIIDDPLDVEEVTKGSQERISERMEEILDWYDKKLSTRINDPRADPFGIIAQRLHEQDLPGILLDRRKPDDKIKYLIFPLEYDPEIAVPEDPRTQPGEILDPVRFTPEVVNKLRTSLGDQYDPQCNQRPMPAAGGMFKPEWFDMDPDNIKDGLETIRYKWKGHSWRMRQEMGILPRFHRVVMSVDCANKGKELSDPSVFTLWGQDVQQDLWLLLVVKEKMDYPDLLRLSVALCIENRPDRLLIENHGNGIALIPSVKEVVKGQSVVSIETHNVGKDIRASNTTHWWSDRRVHIPDRSCPWIEAYVKEHLRFPKAKRDDQVDSTSQALTWLHDDRAIFVHRTMGGGEYTEGGVTSRLEGLDGRPRLKPGETIMVDCEGNVLEAEPAVPVVPRGKELAWGLLMQDRGGSF